MIVYNFNIDMSDNQYIPFEDEVTPGPSRPTATNDGDGNQNNNNNDGSRSSGRNSGDDDDGRDDANAPPPPKRRKKSKKRGLTSSDESDKMTKLERTMEAMNKKLKQLSRRKRRQRRTNLGKPMTERAPERAQTVDTSSPAVAYDRPTHLRSASNATHLRSATNTHLRSAVNETHLRCGSTYSATPPPPRGEESEAPDDDQISLLDADTGNDAWYDDLDPTDAPVDPPQGNGSDGEPADEQAGDENVTDDYEGLIGTLDYVTSTEAAGPEINAAWAERLKSIWLEDNNLHSLKPLFEKYKVPSNCDTICAPAMNPEMKRLMTSKWDKKSDITYSGMQKTLTKVFSAALQLNELNMSQAKTSRAQSMQITADITTMLGHVSYELSNQRKFHLGRVIQPNFRPLCAKDTVKPTKMLFGENVTQLIKDVQVKNKIGFKDDQRLKGRTSGKAPFLGYGRGRPQGRAPRGKGYQQKPYQQQYQQSHHGHNQKKKH